jgi:hypothetical protein
MDIVTAGMHHANLLAGIVFSRNLARVGQPRFLLHRQRVHVGSHEHCFPLAILHHADHAVTLQIWLVVFAEIFGHVATSGFQFLSHDGSGTFLMPGKFWMHVDVFVNREQ